jgi:hypothetical protein
MRMTAFIQYTAIGVGVLVILADNYLDFPKGVELGGCLIGVGLLLAGLEAILTRQMSMRFSEHGWDDWMGAPSVIVGLMQLVAGLVVVGSAYAQNAGRWLDLLNFLSARPGPALVVAGLLVVAAGSVIVMMADRYGGKLRFIFVGGPQIVVGALVLTLGVVAVGAGTWEWFHRSSFKRFTQATAAEFNLPTPQKAWKNTVSALK